MKYSQILTVLFAGFVFFGAAGSAQARERVCANGVQIPFYGTDSKFNGVEIKILDENKSTLWYWQQRSRTCRPNKDCDAWSKPVGYIEYGAKGEDYYGYHAYVRFPVCETSLVSVNPLPDGKTEIMYSNDAHLEVTVEGGGIGDLFKQKVFGMAIIHRDKLIQGTEQRGPKTELGALGKHLLKDGRFSIMTNEELEIEKEYEVNIWKVDLKPEVSVSQDNLTKACIEF